MPLVKDKHSSLELKGIRYKYHMCEFKSLDKINTVELIDMLGLKETVNFLVKS